MDRKSLTLIAIGIGLIVAGVGVYAQPTLHEPVEKDGPETLNLSGEPAENANFTSSGVNLTDVDEDVYIPEERWWSVTSTDPIEEEYIFTEEPPATALSEGNANNMTGYLVISGFMLIVSGLLREYEN